METFHVVSQELGLLVVSDVFLCLCQVEADLGQFFRVITPDEKHTIRELSWIAALDRSLLQLIDGLSILHNLPQSSIPWSDRAFLHGLGHLLDLFFCEIGSPPR